MNNTTFRVRKTWYTSRCLTSLLILVLTFFYKPLVAFADGHQKQEMLAEVWVMTVKAGKAEQLEEGFKKHVAHRRELKDPQSWRVYSPVFGDQLDRYIVRATGFSWADMDTHRDWNNEKNPFKHWQKHGEPYVSDYQHYLSVIDTENSHWPDGVDYRYVGVTTYVIKQGHRMAMNKDKKLFSDAAKANKWPYHWTWGNGVTGLGVLYLAVPYASYADMAPPEQKFSELMAKHLGSEEKASEVFERWSSHFESIHYDIYAYRKDLSE